MAPLFVCVSPHLTLRLISIVATCSSTEGAHDSQPTYLPTYLPIYQSTYISYICILCKKSGTGPIQRGLSTCQTCSVHAHTGRDMHARSGLHIYIYTYSRVYSSRIVQVSRFHLCARRELKTSPSCNVTETVTTKYVPPSPLEGRRGQHCS